MTKAEKAYGISIGIEVVTPEMATRWLAAKAKNRKIREKPVARYVSDMKSGRWRLTHQGIAFNSEGRLIDGQQRLTAIVDSGLSIPFVVVRGIDDILAIDTHRARYMSDILGLQMSQPITFKTTATANAMIEYSRVTPAWPQNMSAATLAEFITTHEEGISFAEHVFRSATKLYSAPLMAPVARAFYHEDSERLRQFVHVMQTGEPAVASEDLAAIRLRNLLLASPPGGDRGDRIQKYRKTEHAIQLFVAKTCDTLRMIDEIYPLPSETEHFEQVRAERERRKEDTGSYGVQVTESYRDTVEEVEVEESLHVKAA